MPLLLTPEEYRRLLKWSGENEEEAMAAQKREYVKYLDERSRAMTRTWPNSVENVNKRNEELRRLRQAEAENANNKFYKRYVKLKMEEQERLMYTARDTVFKNKDAPRTLISAVVESYVLKEREEQIKFKNELQRQADERRKNDDLEIIRKAKEWHELNEKRKKLRFDVNKKHQQELVEQARALEERQRKELTDEIEMQKLDNIMAKKEMKLITKAEMEFKKKEKQRIFDDMKRAKEERDKRIKEMAEIDRLDDRLIEVLQRTNCVVENRRRQCEAQERAEKLRVLNEITAGLKSTKGEREAHEEMVFQKANKEKIAAEDARREARLRKDEQIRQERLQARQDWLRDEKQRIHELETRKQWELLNRFKNNELYEEYENMLKDKKEKKIQKFREDVLAQIKERREFYAKEKEETRRFYGEMARQRFRQEDNKLFTFANKLIDELKAKGWSTYAIERTVRDHCRKFRLFPAREMPPAMHEHFQAYKTVDLSKVDPNYKEPPPPPPPEPDSPPDLPSTPTQEDLVRNNGLQDVTKGVPSKPAEKKKESDYKRAGPANGLQRPPDVLPAITSIAMTPQAKCCNCDEQQ